MRRRQFFSARFSHCDLRIVWISTSTKRTSLSCLLQFAGGSLNSYLINSSQGLVRVNRHSCGQALKPTMQPPNGCPIHLSRDGCGGVRTTDPK